ncbi:MAG: VOC family protein [Actinomycetota bacterium]|nr:VOC family protein [Actinomycetota bacterium]
MDMEEAGFFGIGHLDLSVSDVEASAAWYENVLGLRRLRRAAFPERTMIVLRHDPSGLVVGLNQHQGSPGEPFDERRAGLDHVGFAVGRRQDLDVWQGRLAALGVKHSPVADTEVGSALVFRDPDHIQLELWWSKPSGAEPTLGTGAEGVVRRSSPLDVDETVRRLADAATAAGATVFATIDHAAGARSIGLDMPETQVLIVGNPAAGTPPMLAAPDLALDLPTRVLVRQASPGAPGSTVVFSDPTALARRYGLSSEQAAGLAGVVALIERALKGASDA